MIKHLALTTFAVGMVLCHQAVVAEPPDDRSHVCVTPATPQVVPPSDRSGAKPGGDQDSVGASAPVQVMGCLPRHYPLIASPVGTARQAVAVAEESQSIAALFRYRTLEERDRLVSEWQGRWSSEGFETEAPSVVYLGDWTLADWTLDDGSEVYALHQARARSGILCLVRARVGVLPAARPVLNNWCMDAAGD
jgi:hypothetical protein